MLAELLVFLISVYAVVGLLFALAFVVFGTRRFDSAAASSGWGFRLLAVPGSTALWPLLAWRWVRGTGPPAESGPHRRAER